MNISFSQYLAYAYKATPQVYFDYIYRKISHVLTYPFIYIGFTPMMFSLTSTILSVLAGICMGIGYVGSGIVLFIFSYLFDFCDGNAARVYIHTKGLTANQRKQGELIETTNTNIALISLYIGLGVYLTISTEHVGYIVLASIVMGVKLTARYLIRTWFDTFKDTQQTIKPGKQMMQAYAHSPIVKIKFFMTKCIFSANFYYSIYGVSVLVGHLPIVFIIYACCDGLFQLVRMLYIGWKTYQVA